MAKPEPSKGFKLEIKFVEFFVLAILMSLFIRYFHLTDKFQDVSGTAQNIWFLLPEYAVTVALRLFTFSFFLSLLLILGIISVSHSIIKTNKKLRSIFPENNLPKEKIQVGAPAEIVNEKWRNVVVHINSVNPSDWKLAILECDIMLGDMLEKMGYLQDSIGEKLKAVEPSDFINIESAWEAHKIRNTIAHEGSDFLLNEREAKRVIGLYEVVFREFHLI
jgi:hypothetical protein